LSFQPQVVGDDDIVDDAQVLSVREEQRQADGAAEVRPPAFEEEVVAALSVSRAKSKARSSWPRRPSCATC
jgi:hypothetical protein